MPRKHYLSDKQVLDSIVLSQQTRKHPSSEEPPMTDSTPAPADAAPVPVAQERRLVTELPGPRSRDLMERKHAAVAAGVGTTMPVFAERAAGGVVVDVDGNHLIDLGSGIAVT